MQVTLLVPDDLAAQLSAGGDDLARRALEAFAAEEWRAGRLTRHDLMRLLGFQTRAAAAAFLKAREIYERFDWADLERDRQDLAQAGF